MINDVPRRYNKCPTNPSAQNITEEGPLQSKNYLQLMSCAVTSDSITVRALLVLSKEIVAFSKI